MVLLFVNIPGHPATLTQPLLRSAPGRSGVL